MELHRGGSGGWELFDLDFNVQPVLKTFGAAVTVGVDVKVILAPPCIYLTGESLMKYTGRHENDFNVHA